VSEFDLSSEHEALAKRLAAYYRRLLDEGLPEQLAAGLVRDYHRELFHGIFGSLAAEADEQHAWLMAATSSEPPSGSVTSLSEWSSRQPDG
jgi:hypothetical protein